LGIYKQAPVRDFLYAGMENTSATLFNTRYVVDSTGFEDRSYTNVNAHELAHQWFGNLVTESGKHHWLQEGLLPIMRCWPKRKSMVKIIFIQNYMSRFTIKICFSNGYHSSFECQSQFIDFLSKGAWALLFYTKK
jgi:aminopeptidase N